MERLAANRMPIGTQHVAVHEHVPQTLRDGARLSDPERIHQPRRHGLPDRDQSESQDELCPDLAAKGDFSRRDYRHDQASCRTPEPPPGAGTPGPGKVSVQAARHSRGADFPCCIANTMGEYLTGAPPTSTRPHQIRRSLLDQGCPRDGQPAIPAVHEMIFPGSQRSSSAASVRLDAHRSARPAGGVPPHRSWRLRAEPDATAKTAASPIQ